MVFGLALLCGGLGLLSIYLLGKLYLLRRGMRALELGFADRLTTDTNELLSVPCRDKQLCQLAARLNASLRVLRTERHRLKQGDRALTDAVTNAAHDLRTPLTAICGYIELIEQEPLSIQGQRYLAVIKERAAAMKQLTEELFSYSIVRASEDSLPLSFINIGSVLEESLAAAYTRLTDRHIIPEITLPETPIVRLVNQTALSRIFSNVLENAAKYSDGDLFVILTDQGELSFSNTAQSLDEIQVGRLFDRFYTVEAASHGTGLGLSIAKTLTERLHGSISASYSSGRLEIRIQFPENNGKDFFV